MKLLVLTTQDKFFLSHVSERAEYFKNCGWEVAVAIQITDLEFVRKIQKKGFEVFDTKIERQSVNPFSQILAIKRLLRIYFGYKPDLVWHLGAKSIGYGTFSALVLRLKKPVGIINAPIGLGYVYASDSLKAKLLRPFVGLLYKLFLNPRDSKVIVENFDDLNTFIKKGFLDVRDAFCILGAGVNTSIFSPSDQKSDVCTVVMASRLIEEKGVWDFVKAAEILSDRRVPVKMVLVGEPDYGNPSSITKREFEMLKSNKALECTGYKSDVANLLKKADVFCLPSYYREGLPRVLVEACSCGLVLLTTDTIGCRESIRDKNGFLFQPRDVNSLVNYITYLVEHPDERKEMGKRSRIIALSYFDTKIICQRSFKIFMNLWTSLQARD